MPFAGDGMTPGEISYRLIRRAAEELSLGGIIAYPTEGVWGLGCNPNNREAVYRLLKLKSRPVEKGLILVADTVDRLAPYFVELPNESQLREKGERPVTWVVAHGGRCPDWVSGGRDTLAVRLSNHPVICALCRESGMPLVSTSANPAGAEPALSSEEVTNYFGDLIDVMVEGELGGENGASEIRDFQTGKILREASS